MEGFDFGIPALFLTYSTIGLGAMFMAAAWIEIVIDRSNVHIGEFQRHYIPSQHP